MENHFLDYDQSKTTYEKLLTFLKDKNFSIKELNRAWIYCIEDGSEQKWIQFECDDCITIELFLINFNLLKEEKPEESIESCYKIVFLKDRSEVDIVENTVTIKFEDHDDVVLKIKRLEMTQLRKRTAFTGPREAII